MAFGALLGWLGQLLPSSARLGIAAVLATVLLVVAMVDLGWKRVPVLQFDRETSQTWLHLGAIGWSTLNGFALGMGVTSRIGFLAWYFLPFACFTTGSPALGALILGCYGLGRGAVVWIWFAVMNARRVGQDEIAEPLFARKGTAVMVSSVALTGTAMASVVAVGF